MDEFIDQLLTEDLVCDIALPTLPKRLNMEDLGQLQPRVSALEDEFNSDEEDADDQLPTAAPLPPPSQPPPKDEPPAQDAGNRDRDRDTERGRAPVESPKRRSGSKSPPRRARSPADARRDSRSRSRSVDKDRYRDRGRDYRDYRDRDRNTERRDRYRDRRSRERPRRSLALGLSSFLSCIFLACFRPDRWHRHVFLTRMCAWGLPGVHRDRGHALEFPVIPTSAAAPPPRQDRAHALRHAGYVWLRVRVGRACAAATCTRCKRAHIRLQGQRPSILMSVGVARCRRRRPSGDDEAGHTRPQHLRAAGVGGGPSLEGGPAIAGRARARLLQAANLRVGRCRREAGPVIAARAGRRNPASPRKGSRSSR